MNKQELIDGIINLSYENYKYIPYVERKRVLELVRQLDEPQPIKLKDVIARIKSFDVESQKAWLNEILNELGSDYRALIYKDGYEQGKLEGLIEREIVTVPRLVADYIKYAKEADWDLQEAMEDVAYEDNKDLRKWFNNNIETFARAWLDGYKVEKEKRYYVRLKGVDTDFSFLNRHRNENYWIFSSKDKNTLYQTHHTRKELEQANFGWVFDCPGIEIEEVEE